MKRDSTEDRRPGPGASDWYVALDTDDDAPPQGFDDWIETDAAHADAIARCDAVMALTPRLADRPEVAWAFNEARRLARTPPRSDAASRPEAWYRRAGPAWSVAGLAVAVAVLAVGFALWPGEPPAPAPVAADSTPVPAAVPDDINRLRLLAERVGQVEPVALIANQVVVAGPSIAVLPFTSAAAEGADAAAAVHAELLRQFAAIPGLYVADPRTAASYAEAGLSSEEIALYLGVRGIARGTVASDDGEIRLELHFTDAARNGLVIEDVYVQPANEIARLGNEIADGLLGALAHAPVPSQL